MHKNRVKFVYRLKNSHAIDTKSFCVISIWSGWPTEFATVEKHSANPQN